MCDCMGEEKCVGGAVLIAVVKYVLCDVWLVVVCVCGCVGVGVIVCRCDCISEECVGVWAGRGSLCVDKWVWV